MKLSPCWAVIAAALVVPTLAAAQVATPAWRSGFENGFPGEWLDYDNGSYTPDGTPNPGMNEAWTIVDTSDPNVFAGDHSYKGWPIAVQSESHRAYPGIHVDIPSPLVNSFMVWQDLDYAQLSPPEWVHFATWCNNPDWDVHTMSVRDRKVEMAHLSWSYIGPQPQPDFPLRQWVRFTAYIHYQGASGYIRVWQDGLPILEGTYTNRPGTNLMRAHWGWYSSGSIDQGVQYNDEIQIWTLSEPLTDLDTEPPSPYTPDPPPGGSGPGGGSSSGGAGGTGGTGGSAAAGAGGTGAVGGTGGAAGAPLESSATEDDGGCSCALPGAPSVRLQWLWACAGFVLAVRRRRSSQGSRLPRALVGQV